MAGPKPLFLGAAAVGLLTAPVAAIWTLVVALPVAIGARVLARREPDGPAPTVTAVAAGLAAGAAVYIAFGLLLAGLAALSG